MRTLLPLLFSVGVILLTRDAASQKSMVDPIPPPQVSENIPNGIIEPNEFPEYGNGLTVKLNENGSKYIRFIMWHQLWLSSGSQQEGVSFSIRRSRLLAYSQFTPRFMVLTHFGLNSLSAEGATGNPNTQQSNRSDIFLHGAWGEYMIKEKVLSLGAGLHYYNGISRLASQSTLNFMTLDNPGSGLADARLFPWANITTSDQFARSMGFFAKGTVGKLAYRVSANNSRRNMGTLSANTPSFQVKGVGTDWNYQGYFSLNLLDIESDKLPYFVGSYLGKKQVLNIGGGFHYQPNAIKTGIETDVASGLPYTSTNSLTRFAADVFYDAPIGNLGAAINVYGAYYHNQYGDSDDFASGGLVPGTGDIYYGQVGFLLPSKNKTETKLMPYVTYSLQNIKSTPNLSNDLGIGINWFITGHNAKITYEYNSGIRGTANAVRESLSRLQLHFFI